MNAHNVNEQLPRRAADDDVTGAGKRTEAEAASRRRVPCHGISMCPCVDACTRERAHTYRSSGRVAHAKSRAAIDPSAPPSFLPLVLTSHANVATEQPPSRRTIVRWGCRFDCRVPRRLVLRLVSPIVECAVECASAGRVAATPCHVAANTAGRSSYCVSPRKGRAVPSAVSVPSRQRRASRSLPRGLRELKIPVRRVSRDRKAPRCPM